MLIILVPIFAVLTIVGAKVEVNCNVPLFGENDWLIDPRTHTSHCMREVSNVRNNCGGTKLNFIVSQSCLNRNGDLIPDGFGTISGVKYVPITTQNLNTFRIGMTTCFRYAISKRFTTISIIPHLDIGSGKNIWRNLIIMNPYTKYGGQYSYYDIMINPLRNALVSAIGNNRNIRIYFSIQGEMGLMLWKYPNEWLALYKQIKRALPNNPKVGISVNHNGLCGKVNCNPKENNIFAYRRLIASVDYISVSAYARMPLNLKGDDFLSSINNVAREFKVLGIDLHRLANSGKEITYTEIGIGGGNCNGQIARTPAEVLQCPYNGVPNGYKIWNIPVMRNLLKSYYMTLTRWAKIGTGRGSNFRISQIYMWTAGSWDVVGVYGNNYRSQEIINIIKNWNDRNIA
jgi:hypothetical protein